MDQYPHGPIDSNHDLLGFLALPSIKGSVPDSDSLIPDPDPALFRLNTDTDPKRIQGFDDQKLEKIYS